MSKFKELHGLLYMVKYVDNERHVDDVEQLVYDTDYVFAPNIINASEIATTYFNSCRIVSIKEVGMGLVADSVSLNLRVEL